MHESKSEKPVARLNASRALRVVTRRSAHSRAATRRRVMGMGSFSNALAASDWFTSGIGTNIAPACKSHTLRCAHRGRARRGQATDARTRCTSTAGNGLLHQELPRNISCDVAQLLGLQRPAERRHVLVLAVRR